VGSFTCRVSLGEFPTGFRAKGELASGTLATLLVPASGRAAVARRPTVPAALALPGRRAESLAAGRAAGVNPGGPVTGLGALRGVDAVESLRAFDALEVCAF